MRILLATILCSILIIGCTKDFSNKIEGSYTGTFHRYIDPVSNPASSNVTLNFSNNNFSGTSSMPKYPAIGTGTYTYSASANKLNIKNESMFTADFDWTFIFKGSYFYEIDGDKLRIWKDYAGGQKDIYLLQRVK